ncbi:hypothetical protein ACWEHA_01015 [Amycolatopsis nivea]
MNSEAFPEISRRKNGDSLTGIAGPLASDLYTAGTPPVHGLAKKPPLSPLIAKVKIGDMLQVERRGDRWAVYNVHELLGNQRWLPGDDGKLNVITGTPIRFPLRGELHVQRILVDPQGTVRDIAGYVEPS